MSQAQLAEKVARYGVPWKRSTVVNLETRAPGSRGKSAGRDVVTVQELLALALALDVPPVALLADPRQGGTVPIAGGSEPVEPDQWTALAWLVGNGSLDGRVGRTYGEMANVIAAGNRIIESGRRLLQQERGYLRNADGTIAHAEDGSLITDEDDARRLTDARHRVALEEIRSALVQLRSWGVPPPDLTGHVTRRARELGIDLPGVDED